jgi:hypothetical protein
MIGNDEARMTNEDEKSIANNSTFSRDAIAERYPLTTNH